MAKTIKIATRIGYVIAALIIIFALLVSLGRLLTPYLNEHLPDFESWATHVLKIPIKIKHVEISWNLYEPEIALSDVTILNAHNFKPQFTVREIKVNLNIVRSLLTWVPVTESIKIRGAHLTVIKSPKGLPFIEELKGLSIADNSTETASHLSDVLLWIFNQPKLLLYGIGITYKEGQEPPQSILVNQLILMNNSHHELLGDAVLQQELPLHVQTHLDWRGDIADLDHVSADLYMYVEGLSLPQWLANYTWKNLQITEGVGSAKIWLTWTHNRFQEIQSQFQFYDLMVRSSQTKQTIEIPRLSGHVGWKKNNNQNIFAGNDILIDLPHHLWPTTQFQIIFSSDSAGMEKLKSLQASYIDLSDVQQIGQASGLLPDSMLKKLMVIQPKGEVRNVALLLPGESFEDLSLINIGFDFSNLSLNTWQTYPGIRGAKGQFAWNGKVGAFTLDSTHIQLNYPKLFMHPVDFAQLTSSLQWQKLDDGSWNILLKNIQAINQALQLQARMSLTLPLKDSPVINLSGSFNVKQVSKIADLLPMKTFEPDLVKWLSHAFLKGQIDSGKAIIQGRLIDYPFEHGKGTFLISGILKNVDLQFDSKWPALTNINGDLIFAGASMTAELASAKISGVDLSQVRAIIPYIGPKAPQVLNIQGYVQSDLTQGMKVISQSPLQNTLGKELSQLNPKGPMQLKLNMTIPLKHPEKITLQGDLALTNAVLDIPVDHLSYDQLTGNLHFTEKNIEGKNLVGNFLDTPTHINITTVSEPDKPGYVKADIVGTLQIATLQEWLKFPLNKYAAGATPYKAELHLAPHNQSQPTLIITSDLKGVSLNLPGVLAKEANTARDFRTEILISTKKPPFLINLGYDKILSGVFSFDKNQDGMHFVNGELRFGGGSAVLPSQSGLVVTAQFDKLDWDMLQPYVQFESKKSDAQTFNKQLGIGVLRSINIDAKQFNLFNQQLTDSHLTLSKDKAAWILNINSKEMIGQVSLAENFKQLQGTFQRFYLKPTGGERVSQAVNPQIIPALTLFANDVRYGDLRLGAVTIAATPSAKGMIIRQLDIRNGVTHVAATGSWEGVSQPITHLHGKLETANINQTLEQWENKATSLVASDATAQFDLTWPDNPYNPSLKSITGTLAVNLGRGRIVNLSESTEAKIGLGRMLSLFSLQSIPRRLSLNFSDLFQNGYSFDSIRGTFQLRNGSAYTDDLHLEGPVASIRLTGRIGFQAKDFALNMGVTTYMSSSILPAAVGWLGGPIAGVATWVVSTAMTQATSRVATYQYVITGPWSNPQWEQMSASGVSTPSLRR